MSAIEVIEKFTLEFLQVVYRFGLEINILIKGIAFEKANKLLDHEVSISVDIIIGFHEVSNMLARISFAIELLEFRWLVVLWYPQMINSL